MDPNIVAEPFGALELKQPHEIWFEKKNNNTGLHALEKRKLLVINDFILLIKL